MRQSCFATYKDEFTFFLITVESKGWLDLPCSGKIAFREISSKMGCMTDPEMNTHLVFPKV